MTEIWKPIFDGAYEVSNTGRVRRIKYSFGLRKKELKRRLASGYPSVHISLDTPNGRTHKAWSVHRLVATAFLGEKPAWAECVNHLDGNKLNNTPENLEWTTHAENTRHAVRTGLKISPHGERHGNARLTKDIILSIRESHAKGLSYRATARLYAIGSTTARYICKGKAWAHIQAGL